MLALALMASAGPPKGTAPMPGPRKPAERPKPVRANVRFVSLDTRNQIIQVKDAKGQVISLRANKLTTLFRNLKPVKGEEFNAKPGEPLVVCYLPGVSGGPASLYTVFDVKSTVFIKELDRPAFYGTLEKVQFNPAKIWLRLPNNTVKSWPLVEQPLIVRSMQGAKFRGDPTIKPPKKGERDEQAYFEPGKDRVYVVTTLDGKRARIVADLFSYNPLRQLIGLPLVQPVAEAPAAKR
jgi:hypothetical protein